MEKKRLKKNENIVDLFEIKTRITGKIYVDYSNKIIIQEKNKYGETFDIKRKYLTDNWIITRDSMKIDGYNCFKAICKQKKIKKNKTIAWFTPEIPLQIGPMGYGGLPGFILVLQEDIFTYSLSKLKFLSDLKIEKPDSGRLVSEKTYDSIYKEMKRKKEILEREREGLKWN
jgi:GLPGLI family protein